MEANIFYCTAQLQMSRYPALQEHCAILVAPTTEVLNAGQAVQL
jgi:hypothetical protein